MMIIDPDFSRVNGGCTIWYKTSVTRIKGTVDECFRKILSIILDKEDEAYIQAVVPFIGVCGFGRVYGELFDMHGLDYIPVKAGQVDRIFSVTMSNGDVDGFIKDRRKPSIKSSEWEREYTGIFH